MIFLNLFFHFTFSFHEVKSYGFTQEEGIVTFHSAFHWLSAVKIFQTVIISRLVFLSEKSV